MRFTEKLKELREANKLTQRQIAAQLGIDVAVYNRFEKGDRIMKRELVYDIADTYHVSREELTKYWLAEQVRSILDEEKYAPDVIAMLARDIKTFE